MRCINCMREVKDSGVCPYCGFDAATYKPPDNALPPGSVLKDEQYIVGRALGHGGFGITYAALDRNLGLPVAIKECLPQRGAWRDASNTSVQWSVPAHEQESAMENLVREARKMAKIYGIPGVVPVRGYFYDNDTAYIVMDYVEGETLAERLRRTGPLNAQECFRLLSPVMDTLAQAHRLQIDGESVVHRDIKPNNIMIGRIKGGEERVWLLDLGAAKDMGTRDSAPNVSVESRPVGTPGYMPLEQCSADGRIGSWTDVYALSATFFYCMTGKKPPDAQSRASELQTPEVLLSVPGAVGDVLRKGMALRREERYQTMEELRDALEQALPKPKPKRPKWIPALAALLTVIVLVVLFVKTPFKPVIIPKIDDETSENATPSQSELDSENKNAPLTDTELSETIDAPESDNEPSVEIVASDECGKNVSWTLDADGLLTIFGTGDMADYDNDNYAPWNQYADIIANVQILKGVTSIGNFSFANCSHLQSVEIPDSVTKIKLCAFSDCNSLESVTIPSSVTEIRWGAFERCSNLKSVTIPGSVTSIGTTAFAVCSNLKSVKIQDGVTEIQSGAFMDCSSLESVTIPSSLTTIDAEAFQGCNGLTNVTIPSSVTTIGTEAFQRCNGLTSVTIPSSVTTIGAEAFQGCNGLTSVIISDGVTEIKFNAFESCYNLESVTIPNSVKKIGFSAFESCHSLLSVTIPDSLMEIEQSTFAECWKLKNVTIPNSVKNIGAHAFTDCYALTNVIIPDGVMTIDWGAFDGCDALTSVMIPDSVTKIGDSAFVGCSSLANVSVPAETVFFASSFDENTTVTRRGSQDSVASNELEPL